MTIELTKEKAPTGGAGSSTQVQGASKFFDDNCDSMAALALESGRGVVVRVVSAAGAAGAVARDGSLSATVTGTSFRETRLFTGPDSGAAFRMTLPPGHFRVTLGPGECVARTPFSLSPTCHLSTSPLEFVIGSGSVSSEQFLTRVEISINCSFARCFMYPSPWLAGAVPSLVAVLALAVAFLSHGCRKRGGGTVEGAEERGKV